VSRKALSELLNGHSGISPGMAVRLPVAFGGSIESWLVPATARRSRPDQQEGSDDRGEALRAGVNASVNVFSWRRNALVWPSWPPGALLETSFRKEEWSTRELSLQPR